MTADEKYMREAIKQAKKAYAIGEVDVYKRQAVCSEVYI